MTPETIIDLWHTTPMTADEISEKTGYHRDTVFYHLRAARSMGDPRAARRSYRGPCRRKKMKMEILHEIGCQTHQIARIIGCTPRYVQMRLKEMA